MYLKYMFVYCSIIIVAPTNWGHFFLLLLFFFCLLLFFIFLFTFFLNIWDGFLIRRSSAICRFFAGFLKYDSRTTMKSFLKKIAREFSGDFVRVLCKFPVNSQAIFFEKRLNYCTTIAPQKSCEKSANRRAASDEKPIPGGGLFSTNLHCVLLYMCLI